MKFRRIIKLPEHKKFNYTPVYYDPRKEALEEKVKKIKDELASEKSNDYRPDFKGKFTNINRSNIRRKHNKSANLRLFIIILFFGAITLYIMQKADLISYMFNILFSS
jgi:hypothetical protein